MSFNNNVPLANQTIAQTTDPIRGNFAFLQTNLQTEHSFNGNLVGVAEGVHSKVSMPNLVGAPALPAGTNGLYYVDSGNAKYYDGTRTFQLNAWTAVLSGTFTTSGSTNTNFSIVGGIPNNTFGVIYFSRGTTPFVASSGQFICSSNIVHGFTNRFIINGSSLDNPIELVNSPSTTNTIRAFVESSTYTNRLFNYLVMYRAL